GLAYRYRRARASAWVILHEVTEHRVQQTPADIPPGRETCAWVQGWSDGPADPGSDRGLSPVARTVPPQHRRPDPAGAPPADDPARPGPERAGGVRAPVRRLRADAGRRRPRCAAGAELAGRSHHRDAPIRPARLDVTADGQDHRPRWHPAGR